MRLKINGTTFSYESIEMEIDPLNLPQWLGHQSIFPKVYIKDRDRPVERAALGNLISFFELPIFDEPPKKDVRLYGGMHFRPSQHDTLWSGFPPCLFWLPSHEIIQTPEKTILILHFIHEPATLDAKQALHFHLEPLHSRLSSLERMEDALAQEQWHEDIAFLLKNIESKTISKAVLARATTFQFDQPPSVWEIMALLKEKALRASLFSFHLMPHVAFFGATPEKLYQRHKSRIQIDALAGTYPLHCSAQDLLNDAKETSEFGWVKQFIETTVKHLSSHGRWQGEDRIMATSTVQHLYNQFEAMTDRNDRELISALHPTPATGGVPKEAALELISACEDFDRGWYAAPLGWISYEESQLLVGIRSGLLRGNTMTLFSGAGIVKGSIAEKEWNETERKMHTLLSIFNPFVCTSGPITTA